MIFPKISIVTPSFNQGPYIEETINSVLNQEYPNLEYIIIDGGSTDNSLDIIKKYEDKITYWTSEPDKGMYDAIQKGFEKSSGEIMTWINSDDLLSKNCLFTVAQIFNDYENISWLSGIPNQIDDFGRSVFVSNLPRWNKYRYLQLDFKYIQQEGTFWRRSLWNMSGGKVAIQYKLAADLELWSRFFQFAELYYINCIIGTFRVRPKNQKSLEGIDEYNDEAITVLTNMMATNEERENLFIKNAGNKNYLNRWPFRVFFKQFKFQKAIEAINRYPSPLSYDRIKKRFMIQDTARDK